MAETDQGEMEKEAFIENVKKFLKDGCGLGAKGSPCSNQFSKVVVLFNLCNWLELSTDELDLVVLANMQAFTYSESVLSQKKQKPSKLLLLPVITYLQGNIFALLRIEWLTILKA